MNLKVSDNITFETTFQLPTSFNKHDSITINKNLRLEYLKQPSTGGVDHKYIYDKGNRLVNVIENTNRGSVLNASIVYEGFNPVSSSIESQSGGNPYYYPSITAFDFVSTKDSITQIRSIKNGETLSVYSTLTTAYGMKDELITSIAQRNENYNVKRDEAGNVSGVSGSVGRMLLGFSPDFLNGRLSDLSVGGDLAFAEFGLMNGSYKFRYNKNENAYRVEIKDIYNASFAAIVDSDLTAYY